MLEFFLKENGSLGKPIHNFIFRLYKKKQIANQTNTIQNMFNQNTINDLRDKLATTRDSLSNQVQTANITQNILGALGTYRTNPPCYTNCGCGNSLY